MAEPAPDYWLERALAKRDLHTQLAAAAKSAGKAADFKFHFDEILHYSKMIKQLETPP